jgi:hypothetical protein
MAVAHVGETWVVQSLSRSIVYLASLTLVYGAVVWAMGAMGRRNQPVVCCG